jgi:hypothetical protein
MPIVQVFDPYTGAASGGGSGNTPTAAIGWRVVDDFGSFSASDPNSLVTAYTAVSGLHTLTLATLGSSNVDYNYGSGSTFSGARWYWALTYADGTPVLAGDTFSYSTRVTSLSVGAARTWNIALAVAQNGSSTTLSTMDALGTTVGVTGVGTPLVGAWRRNVVGTTSLAGGVTAYGQSLFGGAPGKAKVGASATLLGAAGAPVQGLDANTWTAADNAQVFGIIAVGTLGTATTTGGDFAFRFAYNVAKMS